MALAPTTAASAVTCFLLAFFVSVDAIANEPAARATQGLRLRNVALADVSANVRQGSFLKVKSAQNQKAANADRHTLPSGWFGDFAQDESTYTHEGLDASRKDPEYSVKYGRDPSVETPYDNTETFKSDWFHESKSGGASAAWQTNYPSVQLNVAGNRAVENPWKQTPSGWVEEYRPVLNGGHEGPNPASWFDNSVRQMDGFGRVMAPGPNDGGSFVQSDHWLEKSVNTTLTCKEAGCTARSSLQLFDVATEEAKLCKLSIDIHPTDYDDDWSREHVEFWKINDFVASRECNPRARGCNATAEKPLYPCLNTFDVDKLIDDKGTIVIEGKNSKSVDECPHQGNLLSGVAMATCMVRSKAFSATTATTTLFSLLDMLGTGVLKCDTPGCTAETIVAFSPAIALNGGKCTMNISVHQTDFDDSALESIEFLQVEDTNITTATKPGKNPCNDKYKGTKVTAKETIFAAVTNHDVTELVKKSSPLGALRVRGKISDQVDECGYNGNLLIGNVTVLCTPPAKFAAPPPAGQTALIHTPNVTGLQLNDNRTNSTA